MSTGFVAAICTDSSTVVGELCDLTIVRTEQVDSDWNDDGIEVPRFGLTDDVVMEAVELPTRTDDPDKFYRVLDQAEDALSARGWLIRGAWDVAGNELYADVYRWEEGTIWEHR